jgi:L,D-peptidoglycan transpeptidase YkuD (ErfK/YbiS/YcfS/YnhG family)
MSAITISSNGVSWQNEPLIRCALGLNGLCAEDEKREGDGKTPLGVYTLRRVLYRADRLEAPQTVLPLRALQKDDGWCDAPADPAYNRPVMLPYAAAHECLWREDPVYDLIGILSHNDSPPIAGRGSAIFMHLARPDYSPTRGCIAMDEANLRRLFAFAGPQTPIKIS